MIDFKITRHFLFKRKITHLAELPDPRRHRSMEQYGFRTQSQISRLRYTRDEMRLIVDDGFQNMYKESDGWIFLLTFKR